MNGDKWGWFQIPVGLLLILIAAPFALIMCGIEDFRNKDLRREQ